ncbi:hypothetical protein NDU88_004301 [Pleurodeles waltl]|uniref:Uncharacterized protein n=1 Tax=Pleurodeles waltl TaxID=8319 RepID=A0AAV7UGQ5_PLEWA|nr:hypothetical protein NDU88_004301 [Pleurodeles waltl]
MSNLRPGRTETEGLGPATLPDGPAPATLPDRGPGPHPLDRQPGTCLTIPPQQLQIPAYSHTHHQEPRKRGLTELVPVTAVDPSATGAIPLRHSLRGVG